MQARPTSGPQPTIEQLIAFWLDAKSQGGASPRTYDAYAQTIDSARAALVAVGLDLDADPAAVATALTRWAAHRRIDGLLVYDPDPPVAAATYNHRLASISSFYALGQRRGWLVANPVDLIDRPTVHPYAGSRALDPQVVRQAMAGIDRGTLMGKRDYALLAVATTTGRRRAELARLRWRDVTFQHEGRVITVEFYGKGRKVLHDTLAPPVAAALLAWLHAWHGAAIGSLAPGAAIWVSLARSIDGTPGPFYGQPLTADGIAAITQRVLGTRCVHQLRHTFARGMESSGASLTETQRRLGHSSAATTSRYLQQLAAAENPHAADLAALFLGEE